MTERNEHSRIEIESCVIERSPIQEPRGACRRLELGRGAAENLLNGAGPSRRDPSCTLGNRTRSAGRRAASSARHGDLSEDEWQRDTEIDERIEAINEEIGAIEDTHTSFTPDVMAAVGAVVIFDRSRLRIERGPCHALWSEEAVQSRTIRNLLNKNAPSLPPNR